MGIQKYSSKWILTTVFVTVANQEMFQNKKIKYAIDFKYSEASI